MIQIKFGEVVEVKNPRLSVKFFGFSGESVQKDLLCVSIGGQTSKLRVLNAPNLGDIVAVLWDTSTPENSLVLGGIFGDSDTLPRGANGIRLECENITISNHNIINIDCDDSFILESNMTTIGSNIQAAITVGRSDKIESELDEIKTQLENIAIAFNAHGHEYVQGNITTSKPCVIGVPGTMIVYENTYRVGDVGCNSLKAY